MPFADRPAAPGPPGARPGPDWDGWWTGTPAPETTAASTAIPSAGPTASDSTAWIPSPRPRSNPDPTNLDIPVAADHGLTQQVPQASLAPGLRKPEERGASEALFEPAETHVEH